MTKEKKAREVVFLRTRRRDRWVVREEGGKMKKRRGMVRRKEEGNHNTTLDFTLGNGFHGIG